MEKRDVPPDSSLLSRVPRGILFWWILLGSASLWTGCAGPGFLGGMSPFQGPRKGAFRQGSGKGGPRAAEKNKGVRRFAGAAESRGGALEEVVLTAGRRKENLFDIPRAVTVVNQQKIDRESRVSILDTLEDQPGIWVEKRTMTTSDPVIRGFSGANILALVDGCSLSTLWGEGGEGGDDMYGKVDSESVSRIEVIRGPGSALYGSNALGGVINFITRSCPVGYTKEGIVAGGRTKAGYGSASRYVLFRQEGWLAAPFLRLFGGATTHSLDDTEGGRGVGVQHPTGGRDRNFDFKGSWKAAPGREFILSAQGVHRDKVRRFYRPLEANFNDREAVTLTWRERGLGSLLDSLEGKLYFQDKRDERKDYARQRTGEARWRTFSGDLQGTRVLGEDHTVTAGVHFHQDKGETPDDEQFTWRYWISGIKEKVAPDSVWNDLGLFVLDEWRVSDLFTLNGSFRFDRFHFHSDVDDNYTLYVNNRRGTVFPPGYDALSDQFAEDKSAWSGGLGVTAHLSREVRLLADWTRGFRLNPPRFGITQTDFGILVPEKFMEPVTNDTYELGLRARSEAVRGSCFVWYSSIRNWQALAPGEFRGRDWFDFNQNGSRDPGETVFRTQTGKAYLYGLEAQATLELKVLARALSWPSLEGWSLRGGFAWDYGRDFAAKKGNGGKSEPMLKTQPALGVVKLEWEDSDPSRKGWFEFRVRMVRAYTKIPSGEWAEGVGYLKNPQDPGSGKIRRHSRLPGYTLLDLRGGLNLGRGVSLAGAVENLTNKRYRAAHSRWDGPGTNVQVTLEVRF